MKPHIVIPLLVVCVGLPLVALGMYYLCESMPIAEDMRKREAQCIAERRQAKEVAERAAEERRLTTQRDDESPSAEERQFITRRDDESRQREDDRTITDERPSAETRKTAQDVTASQFKDDGKHVAIGGISINLPYEQLKQALAQKYGDASGSKLSLELKYASSIYHDSPVHSAYLCFKWRLYYMLESIGMEYGEEAEATYFKEETAFGGEMSLCPKFGVIVKVGALTMGKGERGDAMRYENALSEKFGKPVESREYRKEIDGVEIVEEIHLRVLDDGIIYSCIVDHGRLRGGAFYYFNKSFRDKWNEKWDKDRDKLLERHAKEAKRDAKGI